MIQQKKLPIEFLALVTRTVDIILGTEVLNSFTIHQISSTAKKTPIGPVFICQISWEKKEPVPEWEGADKSWPMDEALLKELLTVGYAINPIMDSMKFSLRKAKNVN